MIDPLPATAFTVYRPLVARLDGSPITAGTVNLYVVAVTGANAGKWFKNSDQTWNAAETVCAAMTHKADGHWSLQVHADCWIDGVEYAVYAKESGDLHVPLQTQIRCQNLAANAGDEMNLDAAYDAAKTAAQAGDAMTLTAAYNAAKTAAAAGAQMDLVNVPNATALTAVVTAIFAALRASHNSASSVGETINALDALEAKLTAMLVAYSGTYRYTQVALSLGPSGGVSTSGPRME